MSLSVNILKQALAIAEQIQNLEAKLAGILGIVPNASRSVAAVVVASAPATARKKSKMSAAGRAAIAAAQKKRWAKVRAGK